MKPVSGAAVGSLRSGARFYRHVAITDIAPLAEHVAYRG